MVTQPSFLTYTGNQICQGKQKPLSKWACCFSNLNIVPLFIVHFLCAEEKKERKKQTNNTISQEYAKVLLQFMTLL